MKNILVTGGTGFIGSNLCKKLLQQGHKVICLDNNYTGSLNNIKELKKHPNFRFVFHDIINPINIRTHIDQIYNLACPASPTAYKGAHSILTTKTCVIGIINILEFAIKNNATVLQASTSEIYGDPLEHPQKETYWGNVNPIGDRACYDEGKRCAETIMFDYHRHKNAKIKIARIFNAYGPNMNKNDGRVVSNFIVQALTNQNIVIYGSGKQTRSFCYIDDLVSGLIKLMNSAKSITGPINIGNPEELTIKALSEKIVSLTNTKSKVIHKQSLRDKDDPNRRKPDITNAKVLLKWEPTTSLPEGLKNTIEYFKLII